MHRVSGEEEKGRQTGSLRKETVGERRSSDGAVTLIVSVLLTIAHLALSLLLLPRPPPPPPP